MGNNLENSISTKELLTEYDWYQKTFPEIVQNACDDFFNENFLIKFLGLSKNINCLLKDEYCFVTKVKIDNEYDMFFRLTEKAVNIILNKILGKSKNKFNINNISELESKIITSFNSYIFDTLKTKIETPNPTELKRTNFDMINLTFILKDLDNNINEAGKIIITLPEILLKPEKITSEEPKFSKNDFSLSKIDVTILVGSTRFSVFDLKNIEVDDVVVFENSNIEKMTLCLSGYETDIKINPNMELLINKDDTEGEGIMPEIQNNLWDSIEVDMNAEFDSVKISLGDLKNIEKGLVVDLTSLYDNNVTLKVEGKPVASGALVIVNDRYGVKINEVYAKSSNKTTANESQSEQIEPQQPQDEINSAEENYEKSETSEIESEDEDFDYSDFELEDENL